MTKPLLEKRKRTNRRDRQALRALLTYRFNVSVPNAEDPHPFCAKEKYSIRLGFVRSSVTGEYCCLEEVCSESMYPKHQEGFQN